MALTLNQIVNRIKNICLDHNQIRSFFNGFNADFLADKTRKYPAVFLEMNGGLVSLNGHSVTLGFRLSFWDLVNVSEDTKLNELDVDSDMVSVAMDIMAQINYPGWGDWIVTPDNQLQIVESEGDTDMYGGCTIDFSIRSKFTQNVCAVPSDLFFTPGATGGTSVDVANKMVYDTKYVATGSEGTALVIPKIAGKKILFITRESGPIYKVSSSPDNAEYTWDNTTIGLGTPVNVGDRFLILYRNY